MLKFLLLLAISSLASSQQMDFITPAMNQIQSGFNNAMNQFSSPIETIQEDLDNFQQFIENFGRSADNEYEPQSTVECPSALLLSCDPPHKYIPAMAYDNYDGTWTYCVCDGKCFTF